jgi:hypothetical protein
MQMQMTAVMGIHVVIVVNRYRDSVDCCHIEITLHSYYSYNYIYVISCQY